MVTIDYKLLAEQCLKRMEQSTVNPQAEARATYEWIVGMIGFTASNLQPLKELLKGSPQSKEIDSLDKLNTSIQELINLLEDKEHTEAD